LEHLDRRSPIPLYHQLKVSLVQRVEEGIFSLGKPLPTEVELTETYGISRATVRRAMQEIERDGYIYRVPGKGTFIIRTTVKRGLSRLSSFSEDMRERGLRVTTEILDFHILPAPENIADMLQVEPEQPIVYINRLRYTEKSPIAINISYLNLPDSITIAENELERKGSLWALLEDKGVPLITVDKTIKSVLANEDNAKLLKISIGAPLLLVEGVLYTTNQVPVEYHQVISSGDRYTYSVHLER
jgi:GntR family transcriptional regulator